MSQNAAARLPPRRRRIVHAFQHVFSVFCRHGASGCTFFVDRTASFTRWTCGSRCAAPLSCSWSLRALQISNVATIRPSEVSTTPAPEQTPHALVIRTTELLQTVRAGSTAKHGDPMLAVTPEILSYLSALRPWSPTSAHQLELLIQSARSGILSQRGMCVFLVRVLQRARTLAAAADELASTQAVQSARDSHRQRRERLRATAKQYSRIRRRGAVPNVHWRAVDREVLRAHVSWENLPLPGSLTISCARDLRFLRQDCEAWFAARSLVQVNASTAWMALGFGEQRSARRLRIASCTGMRSHELALGAYKQMLNPEPYSAARKTEDSSNCVKQVYMRFGALHEAGAMLAYLSWENSGEGRKAAAAFAGSGEHPEIVSVSDSFAEATRIQEAGLFILEEECLDCALEVAFEDVPVIAASPDGIVRRRRGDSFGAWETKGSELVEVKCRVPYVPFDGGKYWMFRLVQPRRGVTAPIYAQVQFQMLCAGRHVRRTTVVSYAVLGGMTVTAVDRNDVWLRDALRVLSDFQREFVCTEQPPSDDFFADRPSYAAFIELTRDSVEAVEHVADVRVEEVEACLLPQNSEQQRRYNWWRNDIFVRDWAGDSEG